MLVIDICILVILALAISFWASSNIFYQMQALRYPFGYIVFSQALWIIMVINLIWIFGWKIGLISSAAIWLGGGVLITNFTTNQLYLRVFKMSSDTSLALFSISFYAITAATTIKIFI